MCLKAREASQVTTKWSVFIQFELWTLWTNWAHTDSFFSVFNSNNGSKGNPLIYTLAGCTASMAWRDRVSLRTSIFLLAESTLPEACDMRRLVTLPHSQLVLASLESPSQKMDKPHKHQLLRHGADFKECSLSVFFPPLASKARLWICPHDLGEASNNRLCSVWLIFEEGNWKQGKLWKTGNRQTNQQTCKPPCTPALATGQCYCYGWLPSARLAPKVRNSVQSESGKDGPSNDSTEEWASTQSLRLLVNQKLRFGDSVRPSHIHVCIENKWK